MNAEVRHSLVRCDFIDCYFYHAMLEIWIEKRRTKGGRYSGRNVLLSHEITKER